MKTKSFRLLTVLLTIVMLVALSLTAMAAKSNAVTREGLTAQLFTDKDSYKTGESVKVSVQVDNHTGKEVFILAKIDAPEGVILASENAAFDTLIKDGETWTTPGGVTLSTEGLSAKDNPATGDNMQIGLYVILTSFAVCGIIALFFFGKNKKACLSIMLCMAMVYGMAVSAVPVKAADMNGDIQLSCTIQVDGKASEVGATVSYVIYEDADEETETPEPTEPSTETPEPIDPPTETPEPTDPPTETPEPTDPPTETPEPTDPPTETPEPTEILTYHVSTTGNDNNEGSEAAPFASIIHLN